MSTTEHCLCIRRGPAQRGFRAELRDEGGTFHLYVTGGTEKEIDAVVNLIREHFARGYGWAWRRGEPFA